MATELTWLGHGSWLIAADDHNIRCPRQLVALPKQVSQFRWQRAEPDRLLHRTHPTSRRPASRRGVSPFVATFH